MEKVKEATGLNFLGNIAASGTEIIKSLGEEHLKTGKPIIYTSADSVFQVAAHEDVIPLHRLYEICRIAREILNPYNVLRVIARPFVGEPGVFRRTRARKDYSIPPPGKTVLDMAKENKLSVLGIGKVGDIFANRGLSRVVPTENNLDGIIKTKEEIQRIDKGMIFTNLIDFDMVWGHRNDVRGYAMGLEEFDRELPGILELLTERDLLILTADHGCDPTTPGTDHSREYVPLLVFNPSWEKGRNLGVRKTFADVGQTITSVLGLPSLDNGTSFFDLCS